MVNKQPAKNKKVTTRTVPYGYRINDSGRKVEDATTMPFLKMLLDEAAKDYWTDHRLAGFMEAEGAPSQRGGKWRASTVRSILNLPENVEAVSKLRYANEVARSNRKPPASLATDMYCDGPVGMDIVYASKLQDISVAREQGKPKGVSITPIETEQHELYKLSHDFDEVEWWRAKPIFELRPTDLDIHTLRMRACGILRGVLDDRALTDMVIRQVSSVLSPYHQPGKMSELLESIPDPEARQKLRQTLDHWLDRMAETTYTNVVAICELRRARSEISQLSLDRDKWKIRAEAAEAQLATLTDIQRDKRQKSATGKAVA